ncbi:MAG: GxGYxYP domain-containing protein [bacterium]
MFRILNRRDFLRITGATAAYGLAVEHAAARSDELSGIFPKPKPCRAVLACDIREYDLDERMTFLTLQGLMNRTQPRLYLISKPTCQDWLAYYWERFGVTSDRVASPYALLDIFRDEISGYRIYDDRNLHTFNLAATMAGLDGALPVHPQHERKLKRAGLKRVDDLRGKFKDRYDAYHWSIENLLPQCSQRVVANFCMDRPDWPSASLEAIDFSVRLGACQVDCSSSRNHPRDVAILRSLYEKLEKPGCVIGWHCARDHEHEAVSLAATYGLFAICFLRSPNYSIHPSIGPGWNSQFSLPFPKERMAQAKKVDPKVYLANLLTDGDAAWAMTNRYNGKWENPERGQFPVSWSIMPSAYHLGPGLLQYFHETRSENDCMICGPAGVGYTYPHLHPNPVPFLRMTRKAMKRCGLRVMNVDIWDPRVAYRGVHPAGFPDLLRDELPETWGFVRGMGESAFEPSVLDNRAPIVYCGEAIHSNDDPYQLMKTFAEACPNRPLFVFCYVNHNITLGQLLDGYKRWSAEFEVLGLDEFMIKLRSALDAGLVKDDLYPEKAGVREILKSDTRPGWDTNLEDMYALAPLSKASREECLTHFMERIGGCDDVDLEAAYQFALCEKTAGMVRTACEGRGIYVGNRRKGLQDFLEMYKEVPDPQILIQISNWWHAWETEGIHKLSDLQSATERAIRVTRWLEEVNKGWKPL